MPGMTTVRRVLPALAGLALLAGSLAGCNWPSGPRYVHPVFAAYDVTPGIVYRQTTRWNGEPIQLRDVYQPQGDTKAERPVMMWMFGGGWRFGGRNQLATLAQDSARRLRRRDHRLPHPRRPGPFDLLAAEIDAGDTIAAIQWLQDNAATYRIDPDAIVPAGFSAGAINALPPVWRPGTGAVRHAGGGRRRRLGPELHPGARRPRRRVDVQRHRRPDRALQRGQSRVRPGRRGRQHVPDADHRGQPIRRTSRPSRTTSCSSASCGPSATARGRPPGA